MSKQKSAPVEDPFGPSDHEQRQKRNFISTFAILAKLASADGKVSKSEIGVIQDIIDNRLQLDSPRKRYAVQVFNEARSNPIPLEQYAEEFKSNNSAMPKMYGWLIDILFRIAIADGVLSPDEEKSIRKISSIFGMSQPEVDEIRQRYIEEDPFAIFGCTDDDSFEKVASRYQELKAEYDPDRLKSIGVPHEFICLAEERLKRINRAFEQISKLS